MAKATYKPIPYNPAKSIEEDLKNSTFKKAWDALEDEFAATGCPPVGWYDSRTGCIKNGRIATIPCTGRGITRLSPPFSPARDASQIRCGC